MASKRTDTDLKTKLKIISEYDNGKSRRDVAKQYGISKSAVGRICGKREEILASERVSNSKRVRKSRFPAIEAACVEWLKSVRQNNLPVSGPLLLEKAKNFADRLGMTDFRASDGWLTKFKLRHGIVFKCVTGEAAAVTEDQISDWKENVLPTLLEKFDSCDVFNLDETGLFWRVLPEKTLSFKNDSCHGGKKSKEQITLLLGANMTGTEKLPVLVIGKSAKPRCFKGVKSLPVRYAANHKAWMIGNEWVSYLKAMDRKFRAEKRNVLFVVDNCSAHSEVKGLGNIRVSCLPPNTTSKTQPMDQGIIQNFKCFYRQSLLQRYLHSIDNNTPIQFSLLDSLFEVRKAWNSVTGTTIAKCFKHAGFAKVDTLENRNQSMKVNDNARNLEEVAISDLWSRLTDLQKTPNDISAEDYILIDDCVNVAGTLDESEIIKLVQDQFAESEPTTEIISSEDENETTVMVVQPSLNDAIKALQTVRAYVISHDTGANIMDEFTAVEGFIMNNVMLRQTSLKDLFNQ